MALTSPSSSAANVESVVPESQSQAKTQGKKKRTNDPGVRTKGSRTYDSANGTTCHQCRQKTRDFAAVCKNWKVNKQCRIKLCLKCLQNRYGENAEEVALVNDWNCPKCRGICNCSVCMKKRGKKPTGILVYTAKKSGFSSVSEMLYIGHESSGNEEVNPNSRRKGSKRPKICKESSENKVGIDEMHGDVSLEKDVPLGLDLSETNDRYEVGIDCEFLQGSQKRSRPKKVIDEIEQEVQSDIPLPQGSDLRTVAGIDLPSESVGQALQFLEFCASFGKALELRKGRAESVLLEVIQGQDRRRCQYSSTVQFHVQLLTLIQDDLGEKSPWLSLADESPSSIPTDGGNSWLEAFKKCISESEVPIEALPMDLERYADLDRSQKLRMLNFLCDEALGTDYLRDSIDDQNTAFAEKKKEAFQKVAAAKDKVKHLKKKLHDDVTATIMANKVPSSVSEHETIVAQIKDELAEARAEVLEAIGTLPNKEKRCVAHRTEPLFLDDNGHAFWKLNCPEAPDLLLQDLGMQDAIASKGEKWITFDDAEQKSEVEKYISAKKLKSCKKRESKQEAAEPVLAGDVE